METLTSRLNLSNNTEIERAVKIDRRRDVAIYDTLCLYCESNNINLDDVSDSDFMSTAIAIEDYNKLDKHINSNTFYFWID